MIDETMTDNDLEFENKGINKYVRRFLKNNGDLSGQLAIDCPAGDGRTSYMLKKMGATVTPGDLFPEFFKLKSIEYKEVDLNVDLPFEDESFDIAVCQEGIEHMPNQLAVLSEFSRVLKKDGVFILTAPNISHLRAKLSYLFCESEYYKRSAPNELDSVWFSDKNKDELYFGHVFLINAQKLRTLGVFSGLKIDKFHATDISTTSLLLFFIFYPFILFFNLMPFIFYSRKLKHVDPKIKKAMMKEQFMINCSPKNLVCKHVMITFTKQRTKAETIDFLRDVTRKEDA